jgi:hypothetical protein
MLAMRSVPADNAGRPNGGVPVSSWRRSRASNWRPGDTIHLGQRTLRVLGVRDDDADQLPVLVVEDVAGMSD